MWKGMLGGALLGLGLGALLSSMGLGGAAASMISTILMVALLAMAGLFIFRMFKRKDTPANSAFEGFNKPVAAGAGGATPEIGSGLPRSGFQPAAQPAAFQPAQQMPGSAGASQPHVTTPYGVPIGLRQRNLPAPREIELHPHAGRMGQGRLQRPA